MQLVYYKKISTHLLCRFKLILKTHDMNYTVHTTHYTLYVYTEPNRYFLVPIQYTLRNISDN